MVNPVLTILGLLLVGIGFVFVLSISTPMYAELNNANPPWENASATNQSLIENSTMFYMMILPAMFFIGGFGLIVAGVKGA